MRRVVALALGALLAGGAQAHPLAPALLELTEVGPARYAVLWRTPVKRTRLQEISPQLPAHCRADAAPETRVEGGEALVSRWLAQCETSLDGATVAVAGLDGSGINVIVRVAARDGREARALLGADQAAARIALAADGTFSRYLRLGAEHLVAGLDHLLFLLGLFVLVPTLRARIATVTAFTAGHSLTLAAAATGWLRLPQSLAELAIAATLVVLALELVQPRPRSWLRRRPWSMAGLFGLVHGLGFAGALREVGVPAGDIPLSLLAFNLGIEVGQLAVIALLAGGAVLLARLRPLSRPELPLRQAPAYVIGAMGVCWCLERSLVLLA